MKTVQIMERNLEGTIIRQNHKTGYFNLADLAMVADKYRMENGMPSKNVQKYFQVEESKEFMNCLAIELRIPFEELKHVKRGRIGETYIHPLVFLDIAMWYSPKLKVKILTWAYDNLIAYRDNSGDSFKAMMAALEKNYPDRFKDSMSYARVANYIAEACNVDKSTEVNRWNKATAEQLQLREKIHQNILMLADMGIPLPTVISKAIEKAKGIVTQLPDGHLV